MDVSHDILHENGLKGLCDGEALQVALESLYRSTMKGMGAVVCSSTVSLCSTRKVYTASVSIKEEADSFPGTLWLFTPEPAMTRMQ